MTASSLVLASGLLYFIGFTISLAFITVFYHRSIAHNAVKFRPALKRLLVKVSPWLTGMDVKAWVVMHRMHHQYSDTPKDPHSPVNVGILGVAFEQLRSYEKTIIGIMGKQKKYREFHKDLDFDISWPFRNKAWWLPHTLQLVITIGVSTALIKLGVSTAVSVALPVSFWIGMMSHPLQGWLVNSFAHAKGHRNFETDDNSTNNMWVAFFVGGEGLQNNHHQFPFSPKFSVRKWEPDLGYAMCKGLEAVGALKLEQAGMAHINVPNYIPSEVKSVRALS